MAPRHVPDARLYPHGSAHCYARKSGSVWLARDWVESCVRAFSGAERYRAEDHPPLFGRTLSPSIEWFEERRLESASSEEDPLGELLGAAAERSSAGCGARLPWQMERASAFPFRTGTT